MITPAKSHDDFTTELHKLKIAEQGAIGRLKGTVAGLLLRHGVGFDMGDKDWVRLRLAMDGAEAAHAAVVNLLCQPVELVP